MPKLTINGTEIEVADGVSIIQACEMLGIEVPRFCYHDRLTVAANCRMCLVEQKGARGPVASCAVACGEGMEIQTDTELVHKARKGVMEFLLINHPLDCPICDQGGECDLQDQAYAYGMDGSRYEENKRAVKDKNLGPLIDTTMTRCIHCTRCIRFGEQVAGTPDLGLLGRGEDTEVGTYVENMMSSEMSGNLADICPVGALTSKPYAFTARPWELRKTDSIDVMDAVGSNIRVDTRGREVMRILPRLHEDVNEIWIADKTRYAYDGLKYQRLDTPYVRDDSGKLQKASWDEAFIAAAAALKATAPEATAAIAGDQCDAESMYALLQLMRSRGVKSTDCRQDGAVYDTSNLSNYRFNSTISGIEQADFILLIGTNPRLEAPLINARLRKAQQENGLTIATIGQIEGLNFETISWGETARELEKLTDKRSANAKILKKAKRPMVILGAGALARPDGMALQALASQICEAFPNFIQSDWNGFNILQTAASRVAGLDMSFVPMDGGLATHKILEGAEKGDVKLIYLLGADEIDVTKLKDTFVIYQGHHGDAGASAADIILPGSAYTEKDGLYLNTEGRPQYTHLAAFPPGAAKSDWSIIRALSDHLEAPLPYNSLGEIRRALFEACPHFGKLDEVTPFAFTSCGRAGPTSTKPLVPPLSNYYQTCPISRASKTMAECVSAFLDKPASKKEAA